MIDTKLILSNYEAIRVIMNDEAYVQAIELLDSPWKFATCETFLKYFRLAKNYPMSQIGGDLLQGDLCAKDIHIIKLAILVHEYVIFALGAAIRGGEYQIIRRQGSVDVIRVGFGTPEVTVENGRAARWYVERRDGILINSFLRILPLSHIKSPAKENEITYVVLRIGLGDDGESILETHRKTRAEAQEYIDWAYEEENIHTVE